MAGHTPEIQKKHLNRVLEALVERSHSKLADIRKDYLVAVAKYNHLQLANLDPVKREIADVFMAWVCTNSRIGWIGY